MQNIVVIGAGIAGLAASHRLISKGYKVTLIEASSQIGGLGTFSNMVKTGLISSIIVKCRLIILF